MIAIWRVRECVCACMNE
uniref:Uncharacterized protein n=1 Tax=Anguilla anguilla TaxID=7936 RepID=A0A0E9V6S2_ANGAN